MPAAGPQNPRPPKRPKALSPEIRELLHMLKSLETELAENGSTPR